MVQVCNVLGVDEYHDTSSFKLKDDKAKASSFKQFTTVVVL